MNLLSDDILLDTYVCARQVDCDEAFIEILVHEIQLRGLKAPEIEDLTNGLLSY